MRAAKVYYNQHFVGILREENRERYIFSYDEQYYANKSLPEISLTLPKTKKEYCAKYLFPFFYSMLAEGVNKQLQSRQLRIDEEDAFGLLLATAGSDTIGAITVRPVNDGN